MSKDLYLATGERRHVESAAEAYTSAWPDGDDVLFEGVVAGQVVWPMRGNRGFGYDPMFLPDGETETFGEMAPERKQHLSHRALALRKLIASAVD